MFIPTEKKIITEAGIEDIKLVKYCRAQTKHWADKDKIQTKHVVETYFQDCNELTSFGGFTFATYKASAKFDEDAFKAAEPEVFKKVAELKVNAKLLDALYPKLGDKYRVPSETRSLRICA